MLATDAEGGRRAEKGWVRKGAVITGQRIQENNIMEFIIYKYVRKRLQPQKIIFSSQKLRRSVCEN